MTTEWNKTAEEKPPIDGTPFWAWLNQTGIRLMEFQSGQKRAFELEDNTDLYLDAYVERENPENCWEPKFWLPFEAISIPTP